ncbi:MAG: DUF4252 domain-containing protein [Bacteroidales bacterium]|nr:MAG: DUF4252 domain-containing protein [Bacteroidales bacterium]
MKNRIFILLSIGLFLAFMISCTDDRGKAAEDVFEKHAGEEGFYIFGIPPGLVGIFISGETNPEMKNTMRQMDMIKVMIFNESGNKTIDKNHVLNEFDNKLRENHFEDLFLVNDANHTIRIKFREDDHGTIREMMILITEEDAFLGLSMTGKIDLDQLTRIAKSLEIDDFQSTGN